MLLARVLCLTITAVLASKDQYEELGRSLHLAGRGVQTKGGNRSGREHGPLRTVETVHGPVVGEMKVEVDQRQGEVVRWTEFKVKYPVYLYLKKCPFSVQILDI